MNARFDRSLLLRRNTHHDYTFSRVAFGTTIAGEFSNGINDCGLFLLGVGTPAGYSGDCSVWQDASLFTPGTIAGLLQFSMASMDALRDYFFWTWKVCV
jgi:glucan 1,3-beta-glucosidase